MFMRSFLCALFFCLGSWPSPMLAATGTSYILPASFSVDSLLGESSFEVSQDEEGAAVIRTTLAADYKPALIALKGIRQNETGSVVRLTLDIEAYDSTLQSNNGFIRSIEQETYVDSLKLTIKFQPQIPQDQALRYIKNIGLWGFARAKVLCSASNYHDLCGQVVDDIPVINQFRYEQDDANTGNNLQKYQILSSLKYQTFLSNPLLNDDASLDKFIAAAMQSKPDCKRVLACDILSQYDFSLNKALKDISSQVFTSGEGWEPDVGSRLILSDIFQKTFSLGLAISDFRRISHYRYSSKKRNFETTFKIEAPAGEKIHALDARGSTVAFTTDQGRIYLYDHATKTQKQIFSFPAMVACYLDDCQIGSYLRFSWSGRYLALQTSWEDKQQLILDVTTGNVVFRANSSYDQVTLAADSDSVAYKVDGESSMRIFALNNVQAQMIIPLSIPFERPIHLNKSEVRTALTGSIYRYSLQSGAGPIESLSLSTQSFALSFDASWATLSYNNGDANTFSFMDLASRQVTRHRLSEPYGSSYIVPRNDVVLLTRNLNGQSSSFYSLSLELIDRNTAESRGKMVYQTLEWIKQNRRLLMSVDRYL
jgi:hypothetical protein